MIQLSVFFIFLCIQVMLPFIQFFNWLQSLLIFYLVSCIIAFPSYKLDDYFLSCYKYDFTSFMFQHLLEKIFNPDIDYHNLEDDYYK